MHGAQGKGEFTPLAYYDCLAPFTGEPVAALSFADLLRERRDLVERHPDRTRIHPRLKPWLSAVGVKPFISYHPGRLITILSKV